MVRRTLVAVCGAGECGDELLRLAEEVGRGIALGGAVLVCGGLGGVMEAAARGAAAEGGDALGILPRASAAEANPWISIALPTGLGEARNVLVARTAGAVIAIGGEWGTLSEVAFACKVGVPVILLRPSERLAGLGLPTAESAEEAVRWALERAGKA